MGFEGKWMWTLFFILPPVIRRDVLIHSAFVHTLCILHELWLGVCQWEGEGERRTPNCENTADDRWLKSPLLPPTIPCVVPIASVLSCWATLELANWWMQAFHHRQLSWRYHHCLEKDVSNTRGDLTIQVIQYKSPRSQLPSHTPFFRILPLIGEGTFVHAFPIVHTDYGHGWLSNEDVPARVLHTVPYLHCVSN